MNNFFWPNSFLCNFEKWPKINFWIGKTAKNAISRNFFFFIYLISWVFLPGLFLTFWPSVNWWVDIIILTSVSSFRDPLIAVCKSWRTKDSCPWWRELVPMSSVVLLVLVSWPVSTNSKRSTSPGGWPMHKFVLIWRTIYTIQRLPNYHHRIPP